jgi:Serine dehydrogenase proteinase
MGTESQPPSDPFESDTLEGVLQELSNQKQSIVVALVLHRQSLNDSHVLRVWSALGQDKAERIHFIVHSGGGQINAAYQLVELLRRHGKFLSAVVPLRAKSAATLLCLGADEIIIDELAQLGPLDTQMYEDRKGGDFRFSSALNPVKALEQLRDFSLECLKTTKELLVKDGVLPDEAYEIATKFVGALTPPLFGQLNPEKLGEYSRALAISAEYAKVILKRYSKLAAPQQADLVKKLVYSYPSHDYAIDYREALDLNLPVRLVPDENGPLMIRMLVQILRSKDQVLVLRPEQAPKTTRVQKATKKKVAAPARKKSKMARSSIVSNGKRNGKTVNV